MTADLLDMGLARAHRGLRAFGPQDHRGRAETLYAPAPACPLSIEGVSFLVDRGFALTRPIGEQLRVTLTPNGDAELTRLLSEAAQ
ncbi:MAG TPA: hypothetical protein VK841_09535 [Polyangiaceae bacterium]|jgi:hypothetical protein|nr:hypothetical protein [Polyangiaceae bacterium]